MVQALHMDVSVTEANLNNASFLWGCNPATHCLVFVQLCLRSRNLFSGVKGRIQSVTDAKGEGLGAGPSSKSTILNCGRNNHYFRLQIQFCCRFQRRYDIEQKIQKRFKVCFDAIISSKELAGVILSSSLSTQC